MMSELVAIGGMTPLMKRLLDEGLLHGDALTVTGRNARGEPGRIARLSAEGSMIMRLQRPIKKDSHLVVLRGNLAPDGAVAKITGKEGPQFTGKAIVFECEETALAAILARPRQERSRRRDPP